MHEVDVSLQAGRSPFAVVAERLDAAHSSMRDFLRQLP
jgi:hypothetical protein